MRILTALALQFCYTLLALSLFVFGVAWSLFATFGSPGPVEHALATSGIYKTGTQELVRQQIKNSNDSVITAAVLDQPQVQAAIQKAFPPAFMERTANTVIDGIYALVTQGKTTTIEIDVVSQKPAIADVVAGYVQSRSAALPACTLSELQTMSLSNIDPFGAVCLPPTVSPDTLASIAKQQVLNSASTLQNPKIDLASLQTNQGKNLGKQIKNIRTTYTWVVRGLVLLAVLIGVLLGCIVLLQHHRWRTSIKHLSITLLSVGIFGGMLAWALSLSDTAIGEAIGRADISAALQSSVTVLIQTLVHTVEHNWLTYSLTLVVVAVVALLVRAFVLPQIWPETKSKEQAAPKGSGKNV